MRSHFPLHQATKSKLIQLIEQRINPATEYNILQFLVSVGWISMSEFSQRLEQSLIYASVGEEKYRFLGLDQVCLWWKKVLISVKN